MFLHMECVGKAFQTNDVLVLHRNCVSSVVVSDAHVVSHNVYIIYSDTAGVAVPVNCKFSSQMFTDIIRSHSS